MSTAPLNTPTVGRSPLFYARVAGAIYLATMALSMFTQVYVPGQVIVSGDAAENARKLVALESLLRAGLRGIPPEQLQGLARLFIGIRGIGLKPVPSI